MCQDTGLLKDIKHLADSCTYKRVSTISCAMISRYERCCCSFFPEDKCPDRDTAAKCFGTGHHIRFDTVGLPCEVISGTSHTALDLVKDQDNIIFVTECAKSLKEFLLCRIDTALSLYDLCDDRAGL